MTPEQKTAFAEKFHRHDELMRIYWLVYIGLVCFVIGYLWGTRDDGPQAALDEPQRVRVVFVPHLHGPESESRPSASEEARE